MVGSNVRCSVGVTGALEDFVDFAEEVVTRQGIFVRVAEGTGCKKEVTQTSSGRKQKKPCSIGSSRYLSEKMSRRSVNLMLFFISSKRTFLSPTRLT
jgi:hypothetical protein